MRGQVTAMLAAVVALTAVPSEAATPTTYRATTTVGSAVLPQPTAVGGWTDGGKTATLHVTVANTAGALTRVEATWVSPYVRARGRCLGKYSFLYRNHTIAVPTPHASDRVRYREKGGRWSGWYTEFDEDYLTAPSPQMGVESGLTDDCIYLFRKVPKRELQLEIRHAVVYSGTQRVEDTLTVSVP